MKTLIDNRRDFTIWLDEGPVLLGESGIVVSFSRTGGAGIYKTKKTRFTGPETGHLTIRFEDENGASVDFHTWCACRPLWPLEYGLNHAKEWLFVSRVAEFRLFGRYYKSHEVKETVVFHQLRLRVETSSSEGEMHDVFIRVYAEQTYARAQYARSQRNELFVLRALVARGRAKATSRTAPWLKWLLGAGSLAALPDELARQVFGFWRPTE